MKPITFSLLLCLVAFIAQAQPTPPHPDSTGRKHDTIERRVPVILLEAHDTAAVTALYKGSGGTVLYEDGYLVRNGLKVDGKGDFVKLLSTTILTAKKGILKAKVINVYARE